VRPKQLLDLAGEQTMMQATVSRLGDLVSPERVLVVTNQQLVEAIREQLPDLPPESVIGEPCKRDTAPCIGLAAAWVLQRDPDAIMAVMPADHVISPDTEFRDALRQATALLQERPARLVTFGIKPTYPAESFGYIERGDALGARGHFRVKRFREKPPAAVAQTYLDAGTFYWNSGIFVWRAQTILDLLATHEPDMYRHLRTIADSIGTDSFDRTFAAEFEQIKGISIDYAVMERAEEVAVIEASFRWDDVGSWQSLERLRGQDADGNTLVGNCLAVDTQRAIIRSEGDHLVATVGMKDCIVVHTPTATLVANRRDEEAVRKIVQLLAEQGRQEYL
jgi:mannose-1-phosphate guanylyltransferase